LKCPRCHREYGGTGNFCSYCGEVNPSTRDDSGGEVPGAPRAPEPLDTDKLRRERALYIGVAVIPYLAGLAVVFSFRSIIAINLFGLVLLFIIYATVRATRKLQLSGKETAIAVVLVFLVYIASFFYMLRKFSEVEARLKGEPFDEAKSRLKTTLVAGAGVALGVGLAALLFLALNGKEETTVVRWDSNTRNDQGQKTLSNSKKLWTTGRLDAFHGTDSRHIWVVGEKGFVAFYDGSNWINQGGLGGEWFNSVYAVDDDDVWVAGQDGTILHYDGRSWGRKVTQIYKNLRGVSAADKNHVWAVGDDGTILFYNGSTWSPQQSGTLNGLHGVAAVDANHVWAVGTGGTVLFYDGTSWTPQPAEVTGDLLCITALDASHIWAAGTEGTIYFYDGSSWKGQEHLDTWFNGIFATDPTHVWAVGSFGKMMFFDGTRWEARDCGTTITMYGLFGSDSKHVRACGDAGTVIRYDGKSWKIEKQ